jgi:sortase A
MRRMGTRSDKRKFRRRRQRAGFVLLVSLTIVVLGGALFFRAGPSQETSSSAPIARVAAPLISQAPKAVAEAETMEEATQEEKKAAAEKEEEAAKEEEEAAAEQKQEQAAAAEAAAAEAAVPATNDMWLTIPKMDLYDNYVANSSDPAALDAGAAKLVQSAFPWQEGYTNTYIAGHRLGWPGTASYYQFYDLPLLGYGDKIYLYDANGTTYTYEVTEIFEVLPTERWVTGPVAGRDMISLQTCIETYGDYWSMGPNWYVRYVVRADKVAVTPA